MDSQVDTILKTLNEAYNKADTAGKTAIVNAVHGWSIAKASEKEQSSGSDHWTGNHAQQWER